MASVLVSHFLIEQSMSVAWIYNETMLFFIGTTLGITVNMLLLKQMNHELIRLVDIADNEMKKILGHMAVQLGDEDSDAYANTCFVSLNEKLEVARNFAARNFNNSVFETSTFELDYIEMRQKQSMELEDIYRSVGMIKMLPRQAAFVAEYMGRIAKEYHPCICLSESGLRNWTISRDFTAPNIDLTTRCLPKRQEYLRQSDIMAVREVWKVFIDNADNLTLTVLKSI